MIKKITRESIGKELFDAIIDDSIDESYSEHRRSSNFYTRFIFEVNEDLFPGYPELWGLWESDTIITDTEYGWERSDIDALYRVEKKTKTIVKEYWERM
jgi:hypothetical protein